MAEEINPNEQSQGEDLSNWSFADESEVLEAQRAEGLVNEEQIPETETVQEEVYEEASTEDTQTEYSEDYDQEDLEGAVLDYISERLGYQVESLEQLQEVEQQQAELDERIEVIMDFVEQTGRDPQDWFVYQQLNPAEMDDVTAIQVQLSSDYPNLSQDEIVTLMNNKYKLDPDQHTDDEVKVSQLQLKIDAQNARQSIDELREQYAAPEMQEEAESLGNLFDDSWYDAMQAETDALDGVEFDLGNGSSFTFGLNDEYRNELVDKNSRLDEYFDPYVQRDGSWDYDKLNVHRAVIDNMEEIVQAVYKQGMSDGQRGLVNQAANVGVPSPNQGGQQQEDNLSKQLREALGGDSTWSF
jgi:hypothetical protein|tara:strand:- start:246 stop:1313 length:1068 start_codon:yes stop_codon:yes gene_type:complete